MGNQGIKTEHCGPKNRGRKSGFWGLRRDAKDNSRSKRRIVDKIEVKRGIESVTQQAE